MPRPTVGPPDIILAVHLGVFSLRFAPEGKLARLAGPTYIFSSHPWSSMHPQLKQMVSGSMHDREKVLNDVASKFGLKHERRDEFVPMSNPPKGRKYPESEVQMVAVSNASELFKMISEVLNPPNANGVLYYRESGGGNLEAVLELLESGAEKLGIPKDSWRFVRYPKDPGDTLQMSDFETVKLLAQERGVVFRTSGSFPSRTTGDLTTYIWFVQALRDPGRKNA